MPPVRRKVPPRGGSDSFSPWRFLGAHLVVGGYLVLSLLLAGCTFGTSPRPPASTISLRLATTPHLEYLAQDLARAFLHAYPYVTVELTEGPAIEILELLARREVDLALVTESLTEGRIDLEATQIGQQAVMMVVHPSNPVEELTWDQVREIFSGQVWDWSAIDPRWPAQEIVVVTQHSGAISRLVFEREIMKEIPVTLRARVATGDQVVEQIVSEEPAAIGYLSTHMEDDRVKVLTIEGRRPTAQTIAVGAWPLVRPINLITHVDANVYALDFVDFCKNYLQDKS